VARAAGDAAAIIGRKSGSICTTTIAPGDCGCAVDKRLVNPAARVAGVGMAPKNFATGELSFGI